MKRIFSDIFLYLALICLCISCDKDKSIVEPDTSVSFDIYVSSDDIPYGQPVQLDELNLLQPPLLSLSDISTYSWKKHHLFSENGKHCPFQLEKPKIGFFLRI